MNISGRDSTNITLYDWTTTTSGDTLTFNSIPSDALLTLYPEAPEAIPINNNVVQTCPVHGETPNILSLNFPDHGINEDYCLICLRDAIRKILTPLNEGGGEIPQKPQKPGISISRYEIAKDSSNNKEKVA